jgi:type I restriction enzyme, S subunit
VGKTIDASHTAAKTLSIVREGDLIINKIWVRHVSTAIADADVDGCAGSGEFPTFYLNSHRVLPRWIHWQTKTRAFWSKCDALSRGTSGKNRINPELFLTIQIPLPALSEHRRIVARIEELAAQSRSPHPPPARRHGNHCANCSGRSAALQFSAESSRGRSDR